MPVVLFRPHTLSVLKVSEGGYDENGGYTPPSESWSCGIPCRFEPNGRASTVPVGEDRNYVYSYTVYLDADCPEIVYGQKVRLFDGCRGSIGEFRARGFHRGQLNSKLWV